MKDNPTESSVYFKGSLFSQHSNLPNQNTIVIDFCWSNSGTFLRILVCQIGFRWPCLTARMMRMSEWVTQLHIRGKNVSDGKLGSSGSLNVNSRKSYHLLLLKPKLELVEGRSGIRNLSAACRCLSFLCTSIYCAHVLDCNFLWSPVMWQMKWDVQRTFSIYTNGFYIQKIITVWIDFSLEVFGNEISIVSEVTRIWPAEHIYKLLISQSSNKSQTFFCIRSIQYLCFPVMIVRS